MLREVVDRRAVDDRGRGAVLRAADVRGVEVVAVRRPRPAVVRHAEDQLRGRDAGPVGPHRLADVVAGPRQRRDRPDLVGRPRPVVVAHDEDRVGAARGGRALDRVVADVARGVERQLVARADVVQLGPDAPDERHELVLVPGCERLEVEVDPVGAPVPHRGGNLFGQVGAGRRAAEEALLAVELARGPAEALDGEHDPRPLLVGGVDEAGHPRARPAAPADGRRPVAVPLLEVAGRVDARRRSRRSSRSSRSPASSSCR